ncbi:MAG: DUF1353 domain-containing protein [Acidobacteriales bacterium]|nr:DUF1353 domain-containing protein [Terriglobales bacterium]
MSKPIQVKWLGDVVMIPLPDGRRVRIDREVWVIVGPDQHGIPAGLVIDGASIPRACWTLLGWTPFTGFCRRGACLHDALYSGVALMSPQRPYNRKDADTILRIITRAEIMDYYRHRTRLRHSAEFARDLLRCNLMYYAVRMFGWACWKRRRAKKE